MARPRWRGGGLYLAFRRVGEALLIIASVPFALVGGIWFLYWMGSLQQLELPGIRHSDARLQLHRFTDGLLQIVHH
jgi:hypothetical protein